MWKNLPSWFAVAERDEVIPPDAERLFAQRMGATTVEIASSHVASSVSHPDEIADLIEHRRPRRERLAPSRPWREAREHRGARLRVRPPPRRRPTWSACRRGADVEWPLLTAGDPVIWLPTDPVHSGAHGGDPHPAGIDGRDLASGTGDEHDSAGHRRLQ